MTDFAKAAFPFMEVVNFPLQNTCQGYPSDEPLCPFVNMSAHFLSYIMISDSLNSLTMTLSSFEECLRVARELPTNPSLELKVKFPVDNRQVSLNTLVERVGKTTNSAMIAIERQCLFRTNTDILGEKRKNKMLLSLSGICTICKAFWATNQESSQRQQLCKLVKAARNFYADFSDFFNKFSNPVDNSSSGDMHITCSQGLLNAAWFQGIDENNFVPRLCDCVFQMASQSNIWGKQILRTVCQPGGDQHSVCLQTP